MRPILCLIFSLVFTCAVAQDYLSLHNKAVLIDTHNDILTTALDKGYRFDQQLAGKTHSDLYRMKEGGVDAQVFSIWCDGTIKNPYAWANREIDTLYAWAARNPDKMVIVQSPEALSKAIKQKKLAAMMGLEGGHMIENDLAKLDSLFNRGVRYMTLTWNNSTPWASSAFEETNDSLLHQPKGLNDFGKAVVQRMNALGMMVDLSHVGEQTFRDAISITTKPVIVSHSCAYSLCPVPRNLKDEQIKAVAKNGGVIHLNFYSGFVDSNFSKREKAFLEKHKAERDALLRENPEPYFANEKLFSKYRDEVEDMRAPFELLLQHLDHIVQLAGVDHVGLGSDFDGISSAPKQLDDVTGFPLITKAFLERGYSKKDIEKILGGNFMRVFAANAVH